MKINRQYQDQHLAGGGSVDWVLKQQVERDICLLYRQLADYGTIMGDLYFGTVYALPYWDFLDWTDPDADGGAFVRDGCLVLLLTAAWDLIDGSGGWLRAHLPAARAAVDRLRPDTPDGAELVRITSAALTLAESGSEDDADHHEWSRWVHVRYVRGYFQSTADQFRSRKGDREKGTLIFDSPG